MPGDGPQALVPADILAPATREQAEKAASLLLTLQKMEKELTSRLKEWVKANDQIQVGDMICGPISTTTYELEAKAFTAQLLEAGLDGVAL